MKIYGFYLVQLNIYAGRQRQNSLVYPVFLLNTSSATHLLLRPKPGQS